MTRPSFTLVVPSYNGGTMLRSCVTGLLAQEYDDYDVLVLDDGSTDGSLEWLSGLSDPRLRVEPAEHVGIVENWRRVTNYRLNEYMTFVGQDDALDPNYLAVMAKLVGDHPSAGLYHAHFRFLHSDGQVWRSCQALPESETSAEYITALYGGKRDTYGTGYLWSTERYRERGGIPPFNHLLFADDALWITLMRGAYKATAQEECFSCRIHSYSTGASAAWRNWHAGLKAYIPFLQKERENDAAFAQALAEYGPRYFLTYCVNMFRLALVQATKAGRLLEPGVEEEIAATLTAIAPEKLPEYWAALGSRAMKLRYLLNRFPPARETYNFYIFARYGEWRGKHRTGKAASWRK